MTLPSPLANLDMTLLTLIKSFHYFDIFIQSTDEWLSKGNVQTMKKVFLDIKVLQNRGYVHGSKSKIKE